MNNDKFVETFREEAFELLGSLETALLELEESPSDKELLSAVFRVMHTIKGSSAMFGLDRISVFSHEVESILAALRDGKLSVSRSLIDSTLTARDLILEMLEHPENAVGALTPNLELFLEEFRKQTGFKQDQPAQKDAVSPIKAKTETLPLQTWRIRFEPGKDSFRRGSNPLSLVNELRNMGETVCIPRFDSVPPLSSLDPEDCLTAWEIFLTTAASENAIKDVFIFVEDFTKISIECLELLVDESSPNTKKLGEILVNNGKLDRAVLDRILGSQKRIGEILVDEKLVSQADLKVALEEQKQFQKVQKAKASAIDMSTIRVKSEKLDQLMSLVGELVTVHARIQQTSKLIENDELESIVEQFGRLTDELRNNTMSIRMVPIGSTFSNFKRLVRDLSGELGKNVELETDGGDTELDKTVIEKLNDPLIHIIRNSLDHGIENPDVREERGKPRLGTIRLSAAQTGASVYITVEDDGNGLVKDLILKKAIAKGLAKADDILTDQDIYKIIFLPGFSTKENVTSVSGRGVGMDVVNRQMELINGSIAIESKEKQFTRIILKIPLTLAIIDGLLVRIADDCFVLPLSVVVGCLEFIQDNQVNDSDIVLFHDKQLPFVNMRKFFGIQGDRTRIEQIVVVSIKNQHIGILVDQVIGGNQTVIKPLGKIYKRAEGISSATVLGDGSIALILDVEQIVDATEKGYRMNPETFALFKEFIETNLGIKIPPSKKIMLESRLAKRLRALKISTYEEYCDYVFSSQGFEREIQQLIDVVTTNETDFFRENNHYEILTNQILPELILEKGLSELNIWSVAASTGQEAYTLSMVLDEFSRTRSPFRYRILGTDISETVLRVAQIGIYTEHQAAKIPAAMKRRYCMQSKNPEQKTIRFKPEIRDRIMFRKMNLMNDEYPINKKYQIVFCRNVFIYFDRPTQKKVLERIYSHLAPGGYLFMGHSENIGSVHLPLSNVASAVYKKTAQE